MRDQWGSSLSAETQNRNRGVKLQTTETHRGDTESWTQRRSSHHRCSPGFHRATSPPRHCRWRINNHNTFSLIIFPVILYNNLIWHSDHLSRQRSCRPDPTRAGQQQDGQIDLSAESLFVSVKQIYSLRFIHSEEILTGCVGCEIFWLSARCLIALHR